MLASWMIALAFAAPPEWVITRLVVPAPLPDPLLKQRLFPNQTPDGDALPLCLLAEAQSPRRPLAESVEVDDILSNTPPAELDADDRATLVEFIRRHESTLRTLEQATRLQGCNWSTVLSRDVTKPHQDLSASLAINQAIRQFAYLLRIRGHLAVARGDHAAALVDASRILALANHLNQSEESSACLVASSCTQIALVLVRLSAESGGPNLLPALLELPSPWVSNAAEIRRQLDAFAQALPTPDELHRAPLTVPEVEALIARTLTRLEAFTYKLEPFNPDAEPRQWQPVTDPNEIKTLRQRLLKSGEPEAKLDTMPTLQLALWVTVLDIQKQLDAARLTLALPLGHPLHLDDAFVPLSQPRGPLLIQVDRQLDSMILAGSVRIRHRVEQYQAFAAFTEALRAELSAGTAWGPGLLEAPLVAATLAGSPNKLAVTWDAATESFTVLESNPIQNARHVWKRP